MRGMRGFTLVEVVIALTLVSLIMLGLVASLSTFGKTSARLEERSELADDMRLISGFLKQALGGASVKHLQTLDDGSSVPYFFGSEAAVEWLGNMPARHGVGGLHKMRLSVRDEPGGMDLTLQMLPFVPPDPLAPSSSPDWSLESPRVLIRGLDRFVLAYQALGEASWRAEWSNAVVLPGRVAVRISSGGVDWPELIIPVLEAEFDANPDLNDVRR